MRWKTTLILLLAALGIGTYISLHELRQPTPEEQAQRSRQVLFISSSTVEAFTIEAPEAKAAFTRTASGWRMGASQARAQQSLVAGVTGQLAPLMAERVMRGTPQQPLNPTQFGLNPAAGTLRVRVHGADTVLRFGDHTALGNNQYLAVDGRPEIFIINSQLFQSINRSTESFRDLRLVDLHESAIASVRVAHSGGAYALQLDRASRSWRLTEPFSDAADEPAVRKLLQQIAQLSIATVVSDTPQVEHLSAWGLAQPAVELTIAADGAEPATLTLFAGGPLPDDGSLLYVKRQDEGALYAVSRQSIEALAVAPSSLRSTEAVHDPDGLPTTLELARGETTLTLTHSDAQWVAGGSGAVLHAGAVEALLTRVRALRISEFVEAGRPLAEYGLEGRGEAGTLTWWAATGAEPQRIRVGHPVEGRSERYAFLEPRQLLAQLPEEIATALATTEVSLTQPLPPSAAPAPQDNNP